MLASDLLRQRRAEACFPRAIDVDAEDARLHQRELGGDVKRVGGKQQHRDQQTQKWGNHYCRFLLKQFEDDVGWRVAVDEGAADAAGEDEGEKAGVVLFVGGHERGELGGVVRARRGADVDR